MNLLLSFIGGLLPFFASFVGRVVTALGFGFVQFVGLKALADAALSYAQNNFAAFESSTVPYLLEWAGFMLIDIHLSIIVSAIGARMALNMLTGDKLQRLVQRGA